MRTPGIAPFAGGVVRAELAPRVVSPPYDALTVAQRAEVIARHPTSYLAVLVGPQDVPGVDHVAAGRQALTRLRALDAFEERPPSFYLCRLSAGGHRQTGVVAEVPVVWWDEGRLLGHEQIRADRASELTAHLVGVGVTSSPVVLAHRSDRILAAEVERLVAGAPLRSFRLEDGLSVELWAVEDPTAEGAIRRALDAKRLYITDGHHRVEAARRNRIGREDQPGPHQHVLAAIFAEEQLEVEPFHRIVVGAADGARSRLAQAGALVPVDAPPVPDRQGSFGVALEGRWFHLDVDAGPDELAPSILQRAVLGPCFGVSDPGRDQRLVTVPGTIDPEAVAERARAADGVAFLCHRVSVAQLMVRADQGRTLPPKSTYFVPKMRSGIFLRPA